MEKKERFVNNYITSQRKNKEQLNFPTKTISYQEDLSYFIKSFPNSEIFILIDVKKTQEGCVFGVEAEVKILKTKPVPEKIQQKITIPDISNCFVYISRDFFAYFGDVSNIKLEIRKKFRKKIICTNIPPIIKRTCGV